MVQRQTILIIDPDAELSKLLGSYLSLYGYRVHYANRVNESVAKLNNQKYTCVLLEPDLLPERGEAIIRATMTNGHMNQRTPFVLMTASLEYGVPRDVLATIRGVVPKPFELGEIGGAVQAALQTSA